MKKEEVAARIPMRLVSEDQVADIICKYENRAIQKTMIYELSKLTGVFATEEQFLQIKGEEEFEFEPD